MRSCGGISGISITGIRKTSGCSLTIRTIGRIRGIRVCCGHFEHLIRYAVAMRIRLVFLLCAAVTGALAQTPQPDWSKVNEEAMRHFQALVQIDTTDPPGNETRVVEYVKKVLEAEGIPVTVAAKDPARANLIARLKGNGSKKPLLIMGHSDTVKVDLAKWTFPPFSARRDGGYIYGRGTLDDKDNLTAALMTMVMLKRLGVPLSRDVIFVAEAGE